MDWLGRAGELEPSEVFQYPEKKKLIEAESKALDQRSLALTMAIMTQVHVSRARYLQTRKELSTAGELKSVQHRLLEQIIASTTTDQTSEQTLIREEMNTIVSDVRYDIAYANLQNAYANIYASIGLDAYPPVDIERASVSEVKDALRRTWVGRGDLRVMLAEAEAASQPELQLEGQANITAKPDAVGAAVPNSFATSRVAEAATKVSTISQRD